MAWKVDTVFASSRPHQNYIYRTSSIIGSHLRSGWTEVLSMTDGWHASEVTLKLVGGAETWNRPVPQLRETVENWEKYLGWGDPPSPGRARGPGSIPGSPRLPSTGLQCQEGKSPQFLAVKKKTEEIVAEWDRGMQESNILFKGPITDLLGDWLTCSEL